MKLTIDIDDETRLRLEREAQASGKTLEQHVADLIEVHAQPSTPKRRPNLGFAAGRGIWMSDDEPQSTLQEERKGPRAPVLFSEAEETIGAFAGKPGFQDSIDVIIAARSQRYKRQEP